MLGCNFNNFIKRARHPSAAPGRSYEPEFKTVRPALPTLAHLMCRRGVRDGAFRHHRRDDIVLYRQSPVAVEVHVINKLHRVFSLLV
jgi:hypothetical protein